VAKIDERGKVGGKHILRTDENLERICDMIAAGRSLRQVVVVIGLNNIESNASDGPAKR
jgi:hypothetical protein